MEKVTFISFPVDFGSISLQNAFVRLLKDRSDFQHYIFSPAEMPVRGKALTAKERIVSRLRSIRQLRKICSSARNENRAIVFQQISPALFALPFLGRGLRSYIVLDWTRKLYEPIAGEVISSPGITQLHSMVLRRVSGVIPFTSAAEKSVLNDYGVPAWRVDRMPMPFENSSRQTAPRRDGPIRVVFVGRDFHRKGGEALMRWYEQARRTELTLTVITESDVTVPSGVTLIRNDVETGAADLLIEFDLLVLPTKYDAFPLAIGEALSAGLAIIASKNALGASEVIEQGVNGYIVENEEDLFRRLAEMTANRERIEEFKKRSSEKAALFSHEVVFERLKDIITGKNS